MYAVAMLEDTGPSFQERERIALRSAMYYRGMEPEQLATAINVSVETVRR